jgi:hypothetical protein
MVIYLFKGYVIFSFLKSRWSDDIEESINRWQSGLQEYGCSSDAACPIPAWDVKIETREYGEYSE